MGKRKQAVSKEDRRLMKFIREFIKKTGKKVFSIRDLKKFGGAPSSLDNGVPRLARKGLLVHAGLKGYYAVAGNRKVVVSKKEVRVQQVVVQVRKPNLEQIKCNLESRAQKVVNDLKRLETEDEALTEALRRVGEKRQALVQKRQSLEAELRKCQELQTLLRNKPAEIISNLSGLLEFI